ncbi:MAG: pilus assembly protein TadG-related protein [Candidatus Omnitrophota bacterium]|jgi:hypothetical protein
MKKPHLTQISTFFLIVIATLIAITFITINIGKIALDKTYSGNATDGGALSAASAMAYAFNYVANVNAGNSKETFKQNWQAFNEAYKNLFNNAKNNLYKNYKDFSKKAKGHTCCTGNDVAVGARNDAKTAADWAEKYAKQMDEMIKGAWPPADPNQDQAGKELGAVPNYAQLQENLYQAVRERVHDDQEGKGDIYHNALYLGYIYNFTNSGISHRLGKENAQAYSAFLQSITPESVRNGEPKTFTWVDGAARVHTVTAIVNIGPARTYDLKTTQGDRPIIQQELEMAKFLAKFAEVTAKTASSTYGSASACPDSPSLTCSTCCPPINAAGTVLMYTADLMMLGADKLADQAKQGLDNDGDFTSSSKTDTNQKIIKHIKDIQHDRMVQTSNFQFHMGGPIKGMRGDVDIPTAYPPVASSSTASFRGNGNIENGQESHDASLVAAN